MGKRIAAAVLLTLLLGNCASDTASNYEREGVQYGVTEGVFRGRWWSYFERGVSFQSGEYYQESVVDLQKALQGRSRDSWRARTYGLHFVEYFPNRELGISLFHLGQLDEAERYLRTALDHVDTERAHRYLDLVTRAKIAQGIITDSDAPGLDAALDSGALVSERVVPLRLEARDDIGVAAVTINGQRLYQRGSKTDLAYTDELLFDEGAHEIEIAAADLADKETVERLPVTVDLTGPNVGIFSPEDALITREAALTLEGVAVDRNGVTRVALAGQTIAEADAAERLEFSRELNLEPGENLFIIEAVDAAGNETYATVRVFRGEPGSNTARLWRLQQRRPDLLKTASAAGPAALSLVLAQTPEEEGGIHLKSPDPGRPYRHNRTLRVAGEVVAHTQVATLTINGEPVGELTGAPKETFNKRIPVPEGVAKQGSATMSVDVAAQDADGTAFEQKVSVEVRPVTLNTPESRMPVAVLAFGGFGLDEGATQYVWSSAQQSLGELGRFFIVDRASLQEVLTEQQLSAALSSPDEALTLGRLTPAHVFLVGDVFAREKGMEIKARVVSTETSELVATLDTYVEDRADSAQVAAGCNAIAKQLADLYPRLSGELVAVRDRGGSQELLFNWTQEDGLRPGAYALVVYEEEPFTDDVTGEVLAPGDVYVVGRARIENVMASGTRATATEHTDESVTLEKGLPAVTM